MKWYWYVLIAIILLIIIGYAYNSNKKKTAVLNQIASNTASNTNFNPFNLTPITG